MNQLYTLFFVSIGGALGASSRYLFTELFFFLFGRQFIYGILIVNVLGSFIMGIVAAMFIQGTLVTMPWKPMLSVGFLGALTTFSTFSLDNYVFLQNGEYSKAAMNIILNVILCLGAVWLGFFITKAR